MKVNENSAGDETKNDHNRQQEKIDIVDSKHIIPMDHEILSSTSVSQSNVHSTMNSSEDELLQNKVGNAITRKIVSVRGVLVDFIIRHRTAIAIIFRTLINLCILAYIIGAVWYWNKQGRKPLEWCTGNGCLLILFIILAWSILYFKFLKPIAFRWSRNSNSTSRFIYKCIRTVKRILITCLTIGFIVYIAIDTANERRRLISLIGICTFFLLGFLFSKHPNQIRWKTVFMGFFVQVLLGMVVIRWEVGRTIFTCIGVRIERFLQFGYEGATFVYGDLLVNKLQLFAFQSMSVIFFLGMIIEVMFYLGWMQIICFKLGWLIQTILGTTIIESVNAVTTVFLGMSEAPLLYKPYIKDLTVSEIHAVMAGGFSTVAGAVFAAYTALGVNPAYVITASVMASPAALCFAKLLYPETEISKTTSKNFTFYKSEERSIIDAACKGAISGINLVLGIIASVIACVSVVSFFSSALQWFASMVGVEGFTFQFLVGQILLPIPYLMGVSPGQCEHVAKLIGIKLTLNEFIAYKELGIMKAKNLLTPRSEAIASLALCSFANPGSLGIFVAVLTSLCPEQKHNISTVAFRSLISGATTSLLTASIAGMLMPEEGFGNVHHCIDCVNSTIVT